jgi:hypothetical protein
MFALSRSGIAAVSGANIAIIAIDIFGVKSSVDCAEIDLAFVWILSILCNKINWSVLASFYDITSVSCARIVVITADCIVMNDSSCCVAIIFGASVFVINILVGVDASIARIASINSAKISIITSNRSGNTSLYNITRMFCAFICISAGNWSVNTKSSITIATVSGTCVVVVTVYISINTFSRVLIARDSLAVFLITNDRSEDALSV